MLQTPASDPRHLETIAVGQHARLALTTIGRIRRYCDLAAAALESGEVSPPHADQILMAAGVLVRESVALAVRAEIAARQREAAA